MRYFRTVRGALLTERLQKVEESSLIIIQPLIFVMNFIEDFDVEVDENSLDVLLGLERSPSDHSKGLFNSAQQSLEKENCVTYEWIWNDQEPSYNQMDVEEDQHIKEMQSARLAQEDRVKQFLSGIKPIEILSRKISDEVHTEAGSPKKKKPSLRAN